jgi:hypothetical protein
VVQSGQYLTVVIFNAKANIALQELHRPFVTKQKQFEDCEFLNGAELPWQMPMQIRTDSRVPREVIRKGE